MQQLTRPFIFPIGTGAALIIDERLGPPVPEPQGLQHNRWKMYGSLGLDEP